MGENSSVTEMQGRGIEIGMVLVGRGFTFIVLFWHLIFFFPVSGYSIDVQFRKN